jgi:predicted enzyme related to lactoylglutathione lyase
MYVVVRDMERAVKFYEDVFEVKASSTEERMSSFDNLIIRIFYE